MRNFIIVILILFAFSSCGISKNKGCNDCPKFSSIIFSSQSNSKTLS